MGQRGKRPRERNKREHIKEINSKGIESRRTPLSWQQKIGGKFKALRKKRLKTQRRIRRPPQIKCVNQ